MNEKAASELRPYLEPGEEFIWTGQPPKELVVEFADVIYTLLIAVFALFLYFTITLISAAPLFITIPLVVLFSFVILLLGIGRYFIDANLRKKTFYGLTEKRIIIRSAGSHKELRSVYLASNPSIEFRPHMNGTASIGVGLDEPHLSGRGGWISNVRAYTCLYRLKDANIVHQKIKELLNKEKR